MRTSRLLIAGALSAALLVPIGAVNVVAADPFAATLTLKDYTKVRTVPLKAGKVNVPDGKTVNAWFISETGSPAPLPGATGWKAAPTTYQLSDADGEHTVYVWARATGGVVSARGSDTTFLDRVAPDVDSVVTTPAQDDPAPTISSRTVTLAIEASDPGEAVVAVGEPTGAGVARYAVVNGTTPPVPGSTAWKALPIPASVSHKVTSGNGNKTVSVFVRDRAGNVSAASSVFFTLLIAGPTVTISNLADYTKTNKPGLKLVARNGAGTVLQDAQFLAKVTSTNEAPAAPGPNAAGWKTAISTVTLPAAGANYIWAWAKDSNGSISAAAATDSIIWDNARPTGTFAISETEVEGVDTTADRVINIVTTSTDGGAGSGIAKYALVNGINAPTLSSDWKSLPIPSTFTLPLKNGTKNVSLFLKDNAGNVSVAYTDNVIMTIPAPTMTLNIVKTVSNSLTVNIAADPDDTGGTGIAGYYIKETNAAPLATDTGWKNALSNHTFSAGQGTRTLYAWVKDNNGTVSSVAATDTVVIDTIKPIATLSASGTTLTVGGSDTGGSGITHYAVVKTTGSPPPIPSAPATNDSAWKSTAGGASSSITVAAGDRVTAFTRDAAGNVSVVDSTADPDVNTLIIVP